jgi:hypothetical protein
MAKLDGLKDPMFSKVVLLNINGLQVVLSFFCLLLISFTNLVLQHWHADAWQPGLFVNLFYLNEGVSAEILEFPRSAKKLPPLDDATHEDFYNYRAQMFYPLELSDSCITRVFKRFFFSFSFAFHFLILFLHCYF